MEVDVDQSRDDGSSLIPIPKNIIHAIINGWRDKGDDGYLAAFSDLLAHGKYQFDDIWFYRLITACLDMEMKYDVVESKYVCPLLKAFCRLLESTFFAATFCSADAVYKKIKLFTQYFKKDFSAEDVNAIEFFLEMHHCVRGCSYMHFVDRKYETIFPVALTKFMSVTDGPNGIPVKRALLQLLNFLIEENKKSNTLFPLEADFENFVYEYPKCLRSCGDYELQLVYTEAILHLAQYFPRQIIGQLLECSDSVLESFISIDGSEFHKTCRVFLNTFNSLEMSNLNKVYSFPSAAFQFGKIPLKTADTDASNLWVDINQGSSCLSVCSDVSTGYEDERLVPLFLPSTDIHSVSCTKLNGNLCIRMELLKPCAEYSKSNYGWDGNTAVFIFEEHVELCSISEALTSIGLALHGNFMQKLPSEHEFVSEIPSKVKASCISNDENEDRISLSTVENYTIQQLECRSSEGEYGYGNSQQKPSKASVTDNLVVLTSSGTRACPVVQQYSANEKPNKIEKPSTKIKKASGAVDVVTCLGISSFQNQTQNSPSNGVSTSGTPFQFTKSPFMTTMPITAIVDNSVPSRNEISAVAGENFLHAPSTSSPNLSDIQLKNVLDSSDEQFCKEKRMHELKRTKKIIKKSKRAVNFKPLHKGVVESSSEEEFAEMKCKRKCKFTAKRRIWSHSKKIVQNVSLSTSTEENTVAKNFTWNYKSVRPFPNMNEDVVTPTMTPTNGEHSKHLGSNCKTTIMVQPMQDDRLVLGKKNGFDYSFNFQDDGSILKSEKKCNDASTQCSPTTIVNDQNNPTIALPLFCDKSTMCSPGLISGPSSTVRPTSDAKQSYRRATGDSNELFHFDHSTTFKPFNTFKRRLAFETNSPQQPSNANEINPELDERIDSNPTPSFLDNCNIIQDFGKILRTSFLEKLAELSVKQMSGMKRMFSEFQAFWQDQLKTSIEIEEQVTSQMDTFMTQFQDSLKMKLKLQNKHEQSTQLVLDEYDSFFNHLNTMEREVLTSTKIAKNNLESDVSVAKRELLRSLQSSVQKNVQNNRR